MGIDIKKIKAGDKITVELTVTTDPLRHSSLGMVVYADRGYPFTDNNICIAVESVIGHTPAPWVPQVGDVIKHKRTGALWSILTIDKDGDWIVRSHQTGHKYLMTETSQVHYELAPSNPGS